MSPFKQITVDDLLGSKKITEFKKGLLFRFLMRNNCYQNFIENLACREMSGSTMSPLPCNDSELIIGAAFSWSLTPEGFGFWRQQSENWARLVGSLRKCKILI